MPAELTENAGANPPRYIRRSDFSASFSSITPA